MSPWGQTAGGQTRRDYAPGRIFLALMGFHSAWAVWDGLGGLPRPLRVAHSTIIFPLMFGVGFPSRSFPRRIELLCHHLPAGCSFSSWQPCWSNNRRENIVNGPPIKKIEQKAQCRIQTSSGPKRKPWPRREAKPFSYSSLMTNELGLKGPMFGRKEGANLGGDRPAGGWQCLPKLSRLQK